METYTYTYHHEDKLPLGKKTIVGVAGSGNLEIILEATKTPLKTTFTVNTNVSGFEETWRAVVDRFSKEYSYGGLHFILNDAGATPAIVSLRLRQAIDSYTTGYRIGSNYEELNGRSRIYSLVDKNSFEEFMLNETCHSPNLPKLDIQTEDDDGVIIGKARLEGKPIAILAQQKDYIGGSVGEVHGAKIIGLIKYAIKNKLDAIVFLIDSGGVRLQEANVGEIEISEIIRAVLDAKSAGIKTIGAICGSNGAYGGMGIISGVLDYLIVNQVARIGVSGAEVIQAVKGIEEFDSKNRSLMWKVYGGRTRYIQQAAQAYTSNNITDLRTHIAHSINRLNKDKLIDIDAVEEEHRNLKQRIEKAGNCSDEAEWLEKHHPELIQQHVFDTQHSIFLNIVNKKKLGEINE